MNLETFGEELKEMRLEKQISLNDISVETRINVKFLEAIENGQFHILPQTYLRAFLREYALFIGLDPGEMMQRYDAARLEHVPRKIEPVPASGSPAQAAAPPIEKPRETLMMSLLQRRIVLGAFVVVALIIVFLLASSDKEPENAKAVTEVPFDHVVRENEAATIPPPAPRDSIRVAPAPKLDSLRLEVTTDDSVWISLVIDGKKSEQHLFGPGRKRTWGAKEKFSVTMGNAAGASFRLNGKNIGPLGKPGAVIRNMIITEANLPK